jgi:putative endonuclease
MYYLYILQSESSGRYYVGQTVDLASRVAYHNANYSKALKNRAPWKLVYSECYRTRAEAMRRERQIKNLKDHDLIARMVRASR